MNKLVWCHRLLIGLLVWCPVAWGQPGPQGGGASGTAAITGGTITGLSRLSVTGNNTTFANGATINTSPVHTDLLQQSSALYIGLNAGQSSSLSSAPYESVGIGTGALQNLTGTGAENTAVGSWACQFLTTGALNTCVGMHSLGSATTSIGVTALGNDAFRDSFPGGYDIGVGQHAFAHGITNGGSIALGGQAGRGNSSSILISGTVTTSSTITVNIAASGSTPGSVTGLPFSYVYTVQAGDTIASIANAINSAINNANISGNSYFLASIVKGISSSSYAVSLQFPGNANVGWALNVSASASAGETVSVTTGSNINDTIVIGNNSLTGEAYSTAQGNVFIGSYAADTLLTGSYNVGIGNGTLQNITTGAYNVVMGYQSGLAINTGAYNAFLGFRAGLNVTSNNGNTLIGYQAGNSCVTSSNTIIIGNGNYTVSDCPTSSVTNYMNIGGALIASLSQANNVLAISGFGTSPSIPSPTNPTSAAFEVNVGTGGTASSGQINFASAAPNGWICHATDITNPSSSVTVATPLNPNRITLTNYSRTTGVLTAWAASDIIAVSCNGF